MAQRFRLHSPYALAGDQPKATQTLAGGVLCGDRAQTLLGVTGSGKTLAFALPMAAKVGRGAPRRPRGLVLAPTRELATQHCLEF